MHNQVHGVCLPRDYLNTCEVSDVDCCSKHDLHKDFYRHLRIKSFVFATLFVFQSWLVNVNPDAQQKYQTIRYYHTIHLRSFPLSPSLCFIISGERAASDNMIPGCVTSHPRYSWDSLETVTIWIQGTWTSSGVGMGTIWL